MRTPPPPDYPPTAFIPDLWIGILILTALFLGIYYLGKKL